MDYKIALSVLLIAHFLGDFYFQSRKMAEEKNDSWLRMLAHGVIYALCIFAFAFLFFGLGVWRLPVIISVSHLLIDIVKRWLNRLNRVQKHPTRLFFIDQAAHIVIIGVIAYFYAITDGVAYSSYAMRLREIYTGLELGLPAHRVIPLTCLFLFVWKPASIITIKILQSVRENGRVVPQKAQGEERITGDIGGQGVNLLLQRRTGESKGTSSANQEPKAGKYIGILERSLTVIFFLLGQYTAIAFTLTAKSIARFKELENADFAEQYLIGTLVSQLLAIAGAAMLGHF